MKKIVFFAYALSMVTHVFCMEKDYKIDITIDRENYPLTLEQASRSKAITSSINNRTLSTSQPIPLSHIDKKIWTDYIYPALTKDVLPSIQEKTKTDDLILLADTAYSLGMERLYKNTIRHIIHADATYGSTLLLEEKLAIAIQNDIINTLITEYPSYQKYEATPGAIATFFNNDGTLAVSIYPKEQNLCRILVYQTDTGSARVSCNAPIEETVVLAVYPTNKWLAMITKNNLWLWSIETGATRVFEAGQLACPCDLLYNATGTILATAYQDGSIVPLNLKTWKVNKISRTNLTAQTKPFIQFYDNETLVTVSESDPTPYMFNALTGEYKGNLPRPDSATSAVVAFTCRPGQSLVTGFEDGSVTIYDIQRKKYTKLQGSTSPVAALDTYQDVVVIAQRNGDITIYNVATGIRMRFASCTHDPQRLRIRPDGKTIYIAQKDSRIVLLFIPVTLGLCQALCIHRLYKNTSPDQEK